LEEGGRFVFSGELCAKAEPEVQFQRFNDKPQWI